MVKENILKGISELHKYGITQFTDPNLSEENLNLYKKLADENKFDIRLYAMIPGKGDLFKKYIQNGPEVYKDNIMIKCMFLEYDGYFSTQDAAMVNDYIKDPRRKTPINDEFDLIEMCKQAFDKDFQVSVKAVGDRAVFATLNALDSVYKMVKPKAGRNRIEYVSFIQQSDLARIKQLELIPSVRPDIVLEDIFYINDIINSENSKNVGLWNSLLKQNNIIISGTDFPVHMINPLFQMYVLATGMPFDTTGSEGLNNSAQKISVLDALKSFTVWSAYACFEEDDKGTLEPGKLADMVVLSEDILASDPKALLTTKVMMTIINGNVVYENKTPAAYLY
jgi:predicted amidohydrolase YtcJ